MRSLLLTTLLLALPGCVIHEPTHQIIYTPEKPLTNNQVSSVSALPLAQSKAAPAWLILAGGVEQ